MRYAVLALALLAAVPARAAVVFSDSFESPAAGVAGEPGAIAGAPPGWEFIDQGGFVGVYDQGSTGRVAFIPDGRQFAYIGRGQDSAGSGLLIRDSGLTIAGGNTYSFQSFVGADDASANQGLWQLEIWSGRPLDAGSALLGATNAGSPGASSPGPLDWALNVVSYTASADAGGLWVALNMLAPATPGAFDDVVYDLASLSVTATPTEAVPEPGAVGLLLVGLLGTLYARRQGLLQL